MTAQEPCAPLRWDSEFWGVKVATVTDDAAGLREIDSWCAAHGTDLLYTLIPAAAPDRVRAAEDGGWRYVDTRVAVACDAAPSPPDPRVRPFEPADLPALEELARTAHRNSRFYSDPRLPNARCDDLYGTWIRNSVQGWASATFVATEDDGAACGYVTVHRRTPSTSAIGLIAVSAVERGAGIGRALVDAAKSWTAADGRATLTVVTQGGNVVAQRLFQSGGCRVTDVGLWLHRWYDA